jgi:hypothetical protein
MLFALIHLQFRQTSGPKALIDVVVTLEAAEFFIVELGLRIAVHICIQQAEIDPCVAVIC